jgi:uncharacterized SAM-binding protein YcdF (DUF218 family)
MKFRKLYSQELVESIALCQENRKDVPSINLDPFLKLFSNASLPKIETLAKRLLSSQKPKLKIYIHKLINYLSTQPLNAISEFYQLLTPKDSIENLNSSVIFIYGTSRSPARILFGAEVYKKQPSPVIISDFEKAKDFSKILVEKGVYKKDIYEESQGRNFIENAYFSIKLAQENKIPLNNIILISASLVALRAKLTTQIFLPETTRVYSFPVEYDPTNPQDPTSPQNWYKNELGVITFISEIIKLYIMQEEKLLKSQK